MTTAINEPRHIASGRARAAGPMAITRWAVISLGIALSANGVVSAVLAMVTAPAQIWQPVEIALGMAVAVPGLLITRAAVAGRRAVSQFLIALTALALGAAGLILAGSTTPSGHEAGQVSFPIAVRDGVILIVGTILVAIAIGQLTGPRLTPPKWNWISFAGITIPGMLILVAREMVKQAYRRGRQRGRAALARLVVTESLLTVGLFIMFYGSISNLTLGKNGYTTGFAGNKAGMVLLVGATVFLVAVRGMVNASTVRDAHRSLILAALVTNPAFAAGAIAFFYGERSVIVGHAPSLSIGAALPAALAIAVVGLLILVPGRALARPDATLTP